MQRVRPAGRHYTPARSYALLPGLFELGYELTIKGAPTMVAQRLQNIVLVNLVCLGPAGKRLRADRGPTVQGQGIRVSARPTATRRNAHGGKTRRCPQKLPSI